MHFCIFVAYYDDCIVAGLSYCGSQSVLTEEFIFKDNDVKWFNTKNIFKYVYNKYVYRCRWEKPTREKLLTQDYFRDYETEDRHDENYVTVYRGLPDFPELRGSIHSSFKGSMLSKLSLSSLGRGKTSPAYQPDERSLLTDSHGGDTEDETLELKNTDDMV